MVSKWGGAATGALGGAATGAAFGPVGAALGGVGGGLLGYFGSQDDQYKQLPTRTGEQQQGLSQIFGNLNQMNQPGGSYGRAQNYLSSILSGDPNTMNSFAQPYLQQFEQQIVPQLANRFAAIGGAHGGGAIGSSSFAQALGGAGAQLQSNLAGLFANLQRGAASDVSGQYNNLASLGLGQSPFENIYERGTTGPMGGLASGLAQGAGQYAGNQGIEQLMNYLNQSRQNNYITGPGGGGDSYNPYTGYQGNQYMG